ncbi:YbhB/YbcL family Raf kinase inhibitor-like protein [Ectobacillus polymachus]|uniref:YbhB/YbcL family Raf kinase inhibitor-like protein n=1 Tax=Ectobacillus polymachus TaxID=1508806 RepID=UPI003A84A79B
MKVTVMKENEYLPEKYSKYASDRYKNGDNPIVSFPIQFKDIPEGTKSLALTFVDHDAIPVCGFTWIHWLACNINPSTDRLQENMSQKNTLGIVQGQNSFASPFVGNTDINVIHRYVGPTPPDRDHVYTLTVYALDKVLDLKEGYLLNDFYKEIEGHVISDVSENILAKK